MDSQGRGGVVRWTALLAMACFFPRSFASDEIKNSSSSPGAASVPDFSAVYKVDRNYPGTSVIACVTEDTNTTIITRLVPPRLPSPTFKDRGWAQEVQWPALKQGEAAARGVVCGSAGAPLYPVAFPLMSWKARLVPQYLSYTISPGEELRARLLGAEPRGAVWWQREPLQPAAWRHTTLDDNGTLIIPAAMLSGSGFYSFANENNVTDTRILGTFSLQIRDCPAHRYGEDCSDWCPDCLHGGVCHPRSGQCVCQESLMGRRCEVSCKKHMSGRRCTVPIINVPGKQVCRPFPVPCRCSPGFTGPRCNTTCSAGEWGADCALNCRHHCIGNCDSETGDCDDQGPSPCSGGDFGLPRLRRAPKVTDIGSSTATVLFTRWREGYDDGDAALWDTISYIIRLRTSNATYSYEKNFIALGPRHTLPSLTPATQYEVMVVVAAWRATRNLTCVADGKGRERVHSVFFTTTCPEEISAPVILRTEKTSDTSVFVRWKRVSLPRGCHVQYNLSAIPGASDEASGALETRHITLTGLTKTYAEVAGLEANVVYTIQVLARCTSQPYPSAYSSTLLVIPGKGVVGYGKVVAGGLVGAAVLVVMMVSLWRRKRRQPPPPCNASLPSASPSPPLPCSRGTADGGVAEDGAAERLNNAVI